MVEIVLIKTTISNVIVRLDIQETLVKSVSNLLLCILNICIREIISGVWCFKVLIPILFAGVCTTDYCKNGGNCLVDAHGNPICDCAPGFVGDTCEKGDYWSFLIIFIIFIIQFYLLNSIKFFSKFEIVEDKCTEEKNSCEHGTCSNVDNGNGYFCDCDVGYTGVNCTKGNYWPYYQVPIRLWLLR